MINISFKSHTFLIAIIAPIWDKVYKLIKMELVISPEFDSIGFFSTKDDTQEDLDEMEFRLVLMWTMKIIFIEAFLILSKPNFKKIIFLL